MKPSTGQTKKSSSSKYLVWTFIASLATALVLAFIIFDIAKKNPDPAEVESALRFIAAVLGVGLLFTWPGWLYAKLNDILQSTVEPLDRSGDKSTDDFEGAVTPVFGKELISNIFSYEDYCRNEYVQDMRKHHLAWLLVAISGAITVIAALLVIVSSRAGGNGNWIEAVGVTLPALVTGVLLKIWLETRDNLDQTRRRTDIIYRQRIRFLLLVGKHSKGRKLPDSITLNRQILDYINLPEIPDETAAVPEAPATA